MGKVLIKHYRNVHCCYTVLLLSDMTKQYLQMLQENNLSQIYVSCDLNDLGV